MGEGASKLMLMLIILCTVRKFTFRAELLKKPLSFKLWVTELTDTLHLEKNRCILADMLEKLKKNCCQFFSCREGMAEKWYMYISVRPGPESEEEFQSGTTRQPSPDLHSQVS